MHETRGPFVFVSGVDALEGFFHVGGIEPDQRILADFGAPDGFDLDLVDGALAALFLACRFLGKPSRRIATAHAISNVQESESKFCFVMIRGPHCVWLAVSKRPESIRKGRTELVRPWKLQLHAST